MARLQKIHLVTRPGKDSTVSDILILNATPASLRLQYLGGLGDGRDTNDVLAWFDDETEARAFACDIIKARDILGAACIR